MCCSKTTVSEVDSAKGLINNIVDQFTENEVILGITSLNAGSVALGSTTCQGQRHGVVTEEGRGMERWGERKGNGKGGIGRRRGGQRRGEEKRQPLVGSVQ